jgi:hypothetical protein
MSYFDNDRRGLDAELTELAQREERERDAMYRSAAADRANPNPLDKLTPEQLLEAWQRAEATDAERVKHQLQFDATAQFMEAHPEYVACQKNGGAITSYFEWRGLDGTDPAHYEEAWAALAERGMVDVNAQAAQTALTSERKRRQYHRSGLEAKAQWDAEQEAQRRTNPENMTMDELREAAMKENF